MSCLINGLIPTHLVSDGIATLDPDKFGGWEIGTWDYPPYLQIFKDATGVDKDEYIKTPREIDKQAQRWGYVYNFSDKECEQIAAHLKSLDKHPNNKSIYAGDFLGDKMKIKRKWFVKLVKLFEDKNVSFYGR